MARFCGKIGFSISTESTPGVWTETIVERKYYGDVVRDVRRNQDQAKVVEDFNISNQFSIVADSFMNENLQFARYITYLGMYWKIQSFEVQYPRLVISVGGVYNGPKGQAT